MAEDATSKEQELREFYQSLLTHFPDRSIRWLLQEKENVQGLIEIVADELVEHIDFSQLELQNRSFISNTLREQESDLLFSVPFNSGTETDELLIYILIEHQSTVDVSMGFRLLFYMMNIWDTQRQQWETDNVPKSEWRLQPILPIVLYSGDRRWLVPLSLTAIMDIPEILTRFVPKFDTLFLSVKETNPHELTKSDHPFGWLLAVLHNEKADKQTIIETLTEAIAYLNTLEPEQSEQRLRAIHYLLLFIANRRNADEHRELIELVQQQTDEMEVETMAKTMADVYIEQGKAQGIQQGIEQGKAQGIEQGKAQGIEQGKAQGIEQGKAQGIEQGEIQAKREMILKLLDIHIGDIPDTVSKKVSRIRSRSRLDSLLEQVATAKTLDDIKWN